MAKRDQICLVQKSMCPFKTGCLCFTSLNQFSVFQVDISRHRLAACSVSGIDRITFTSFSGESVSAPISKDGGWLISFSYFHLFIFTTWHLFPDPCFPAAICSKKGHLLPKKFATLLHVQVGLVCVSPQYPDGVKVTFDFIALQHVHPKGCIQGSAKCEFTCQCVRLYE